VPSIDFHRCDGSDCRALQTRQHIQPTRLLSCRRLSARARMQLLLRGARTTSAARCLCQRCAVGPGHATGSTPAAAATNSLMAEGPRPHSSAADGDAGPQMSEQEQLIADKLRSALVSPQEVTVTVRRSHSMISDCRAQTGSVVLDGLLVSSHPADGGAAQRLRVGHCCDTSCQRRLPCQLPGLSYVATG